MGHTKPKDLEDITDVLDQIRRLKNLKEKGFGIFYLKSKPFLHFHDKDGRRWAHVRVESAWEILEIDFAATKLVKTKFVSRIRKILGSANQ